MIKRRMPAVHISLGFAVIVTIALLTNSYEMFLLTSISVVIHELAHIAMIYFLGGSITGIWLEVCGAHIGLNNYPIMSYKKEFAVAAAGPMVSLVSAYFFSLFGRFLVNESLYILSGFSCVLGLINLIPAYPLDGGRMIKCITSIFLSDEKVKIIGISCCGLSAALMVAFCLFVNLHMGFNLSLTVFCVFIVVAFIKNISVY